MQTNSEQITFQERLLQLYTFHKMNKDFKTISFELFHVAASSFSGPIATMRDRNVSTELSIPDELQNNIVIFSHKGKMLKKMPFATNQRVITFSFTNDEILLIVLNTGQYYLMDPFRGSSLKEFKLGESFTSEAILSCKTIDSKIYFLSSNKRIYEIKNIFQPVAKEIILLSIRIDNPVFHISINDTGVIDVFYLHESNEIHSWNDSEKILASQYLTDRKSKLVYINRRVYQDENYMIVVFHQPLRIGFCRGRKVNYYQPGLKIVEDCVMKKTRDRGSSWREVSYHTGWLGDIAILSNNLWILMVSITRCQLLQAVPMNGRICGQIDAVRIYSDNNYILRLVPDSYRNLFLDGSDSRINLLYKAFQSYEKGQFISKETLQSQRPNIESHLSSIVEAACFSLEALEQMRILKFGIFVKTYYCLTVNLKELCDELRFINNLKCEYLNRCLTLHEFQHLKQNEKDRLLNILLRYNLHYLGEIVGGGEKIYVHWAKCKIEKENQDVALKEILEKFQSYQEKEAKKISYIDIARYAMQTGRYLLAQNLIAYEPNIEKRVTILLWMAVVKKDGGFLEKAIENSQISKSSDIMFKVARQINKLPTVSESIMKVIEKNIVFKKHYLQYLREKNPAKLKEYYIKNKSTHELGFLAIKENLNRKQKIPEDSLQIIMKFLPTVNEGLNNKKMSDYALYLKKIKQSSAAVDQAELDKFKNVDHPEYLAQALVERGLVDQAVRVLYWVKTQNAYRFLEQIGKWKESATLAKERKDLPKLREMLQQAPQEYITFINQLLSVGS